MLFWAFLAHFIAFGLLCPILFFWASLARFIAFGLLCPIFFFWASLAHFIAFGLLCPFLFFWVSLARFIAFGLLCPIRAPLYHLFSLEHPGPVCFPWASSAHFLTSHYHRLLLTSLGFPGPITLFSSLGLMGLPSTPYFLCFHYFGSIAAHSHFFTSYTAHDLLFLSFRAPLGPFTSSRPICLSHGPVIHYSCHLSLMVFFSIY